MRGLLAPIWPYLAALGATLAAAIGIHRAGHRSGVTETTQKLKDADHARAREIEEAADQARRSDAARTDPLRVLRDAGQLRD